MFELRIKGALYGVMLGALLCLCAPYLTHAEIPANLDFALQFGEHTGVNPIATGRRSPSDPLERAALKRAVSRLNPKQTSTKISDEITTPDQDVTQPEKTETKVDAFKPKVPSWPHSVAIGSPSGGWLVNGVRLLESDRVAVRATNYGTQEMVDAIKYAVDVVHEKHPGTKRLPVGDLSRKRGGFFPPHVSHQNGRDADIGFYLRKGHNTKYLKYATPRTLDVPRTWTFLEAMMADDKVLYIFIDKHLIRSLYRHAKKTLNIPGEKLAEYFMAYGKGYPGSKGIIRHLKGHADHMHVRFHAPDSIAAIKEYVRRHGRKVLKPLPTYTRVRSGDSLWRIARRHRVSIKKLLRWNRISRRKILRPGKKLIVGWRRPRLPSSR